MGITRRRALWNSAFAVGCAARVLEGDMFLTESYVAGAASPVVREMTLGDLLRKAAEDHPALIAGVPDPALRRQRTYAQFYREAQRTARALLPLCVPKTLSGLMM